MAQPIRVHLLHKLRSVHDAKHAISRAYDEGKTRCQRKRKAFAAAPAYLKCLVELPAVLVMEGGGGEEEEVRTEELKHFVMGDKVSKEVFTDLMDLMLPKWDENRKRT